MNIVQLVMSPLKSFQSKERLRFFDGKTAYARGTPLPLLRRASQMRRRPGSSLSHCQEWMQSSENGVKRGNVLNKQRK